MNTIKNIWESFSSFWSTYEGIATIWVIIALAAKLFVNNRATSLDYKKMIIAIPGETTFLVLGFLLSDMISNSLNETKNITGITVCVLVFIFQLAVERIIIDKLSDINFGIVIGIIAMYIISILLYLNAIFWGS